ncbi:hypothetical protein L2E82_12750 [Cichorium intybus]|uniref:Uncharacterized protein n=1 Tax=Cichorium intybus TaxID=13427 RepID=A0ACB9GI71_CICIN|nr:hypothetical protein L2E82_12750 [Cichorium intybus]
MKYRTPSTKVAWFYGWFLANHIHLFRFQKIWKGSCRIRLYKFVHFIYLVDRLAKVKDFWFYLVVATLFL